MRKRRQLDWQPLLTSYLLNVLPIGARADQAFDEPVGLPKLKAHIVGRLGQCGVVDTGRPGIKHFLLGQGQARALARRKDLQIFNYPAAVTFDLASIVIHFAVDH